MLLSENEFLFSSHLWYWWEECDVSASGDAAKLKGSHWVWTLCCCLTALTFWVTEDQMEGQSCTIYWIIFFLIKSAYFYSILPVLFLWKIIHPVKWLLCLYKKHEQKQWVLSILFGKEMFGRANTVSICRAWASIFLNPLASLDFWVLLFGWWLTVWQGSQRFQFQN